MSVFGCGLTGKGGDWSVLATLVAPVSELSEQRKSRPRYQMTKGPLVGPFFVLASEAGFGSAKQVHSEVDAAVRHN